MAKIERKTITQKEVVECFYYKDGFLYWKKVKTFSNRNVGDIASVLLKSSKRYRSYINGKMYFSSRLIFLYHHGWLPDYVDHENRNTMDDRIGNLRPASSSQNQANKTKTQSKTSSIYKGVNIQKIKNYTYWQSAIWVDGKRIFGGSFKTEQSAALNYNKQAIKYFGEFANLNIIIP